MKVDVRIPVGLRNLGIIDLRQPVIGRHRAGIAENQAAYRVGDGRILLYSPVLHLHVAVYYVLII